MIDFTKEKGNYISGFARFEKQMDGKHPWLNDIRRNAMSRFDRLGFPTTRDEEWRFTNISPILKVPFQHAASMPDPPTVVQFADYAVCESECNRLVFLNGFYSEALSTIRRLPDGVRISSLADAFRTERHLLEPVFDSSFRDKDPFAALNTAFLSDGAFVYLPPGTALEDPVYLLYFSTSRNEPALVSPRSVIIAGSGSRASIVESYAGTGGDPYFTNSVTQVLMAEGSAIDHYKLQREGGQAYHMATARVVQDRDSAYKSHSLSLGGVLVRNNLNVLLNGTGADCTLNGLYVTRGRQHMDNHTSIDHAEPNCSSTELYKGIMDDTSSAVFNGRIVVRKDAQKTNARQTNKNLLLSRNAGINTMPQLEIFADDVKCAHGATIGQLNEEELFYLRSRGIDSSAARTLLTYAFASDLLNAVGIKPIQCKINLVLLDMLSRPS